MLTPLFVEIELGADYERALQNTHFKLYSTSVACSGQKLWRSVISGNSPKFPEISGNLNIIHYFLNQNGANVFLLSWLNIDRNVLNQMKSRKCKINGIIVLKIAQERNRYCFK